MLKVLILDKKDWLLPEKGPGAPGGYYKGSSGESGSGCGWMAYGCGDGHGAGHCSGNNCFNIIDHSNGIGYGN